MFTNRKTVRLGTHARQGLSFVEFVGCMLAMGGGVAIGSFYLGVDIQTVAIGILESAELVEPGYFASNASAQKQLTNSDKNVSGGVAQKTVLNEAIKSQPYDQTEATPLKAEDNPENTSTVLTTIPELTDEQRHIATQEYWNALTDCMFEEASQRAAGIVSNTNWQLFDYLTHRRDGHTKAIEAIEQLDEQGVDARLISHAHQVLTWNRAGKKLYGRAVDLLTDAPTDELTGPFAQSWQSSATQHRMEEKLLRDKHAAVTSYLDHTYKAIAPFQGAYSR